MKKIITLLAIVGFFAACNNAGKTSTTDSTKVSVDSVKTTTVDTSKTTVDTSKKAMDTTKKM